MNGSILLLVACAVFGAGYFIYSRFVARWLGLDARRKTPAQELADGRDYVPTNRVVLLGSHFAAIAGAGPVLGPVLASPFGWGAVALWIVLGCVLIGSVHDMTALFLSVRHKGVSIGSIIEGILGRRGKMVFLIFCFVTLIFVMAEFTRQVAASFVSNPEVASASLLSIPQAALFGYLVYRKRWSVLVASLIFVPMLFGLLWLGIIFPCDLQALLGVSAAQAQLIWTAVLLAYCFIASAFPVWLMLQPRGYLNAWLLYAMLAMGLVGILIACPVLQADAFAGFSLESSVKGTMYLFPLLFVTVACGACSGFHSLVSSGTTSKQVANEKDIRFVGYGAMLLEGVVAIMALIAVAILPQSDLFVKVTQGTVPPVRLFAEGLAGFATSFGLPETLGVSFVMLAVAAFLMTTVDACTRLARFTWQELMTPPQGVTAGKSRKILSNTNMATGIVVAICLFLLVGCPAITKNLWTIFASGNQLLAALALLTATLWLSQNGKRCFFVLIPMIFMLVTSLTAVVQLILMGMRTWKAAGWMAGFGSGGVLTIGTTALFCLGVYIFTLGLKTAWNHARAHRPELNAESAK